MGPVSILLTTDRYGNPTARVEGEDIDFSATATTLSDLLILVRKRIEGWAYVEAMRSRARKV